MRLKVINLIRAVLPALLFLAVIYAALWQYKKQTQPTPVRYLVAEQALRKGDTAGARQDFEKVLHVRPTDLTAYVGAIDTCIAANRLDLAAEYIGLALQKVTSLNRFERARFYALLAQQYATIESVPNQKRAKEAAKKALDLVPEDSSFQNTYGYILADNATGKGPDTDAALKILRAALSSMKGAPNTMADAAARPLLTPLTEDSYGWALVKNGDYAEAITVLTQAIVDYPQNSGAAEVKATYYHLGEAHRLAGQFQEARNAYQNSLYLDAHYPDALAGIAKLPEDAKPGVQSPSAPTAPVKPEIKK